MVAKMTITHDNAGKCTNNQTYILESRRSVEGTKSMIQKIKTMTNMSDSLLVVVSDLNGFLFFSFIPIPHFLPLLVFVCLKI